MYMKFSNYAQTNKNFPKIFRGKGRLFYLLQLFSPILTNIYQIQVITHNFLNSLFYI